MKNIKFSLTKTNKAKSIQHFFKMYLQNQRVKKKGILLVLYLSNWQN